MLLGIGFFYFYSRSGSKVPSAGARGKYSTGPTPVVGARTHKGDIGVYFTGLGAVTPIYTVTVKTRVDGELMKVLYREGQIVHKGELLVQVDPRPYQVQLTQAEGQLMRDLATLNNAETDLSRYMTLLPRNAIPEQQVATQKAAIAQTRAAVKIDDGQIAGAKLNILYCHIAAPITGRVGLRLVDPGNIVHATDANGLAVITQLQPISVIFTIPEDHVGTVFEKIRTGQRLRVDAYDREDQHRISQGVLETLDNEID
ncbi:MAG TPA: efflux RND transporter periplasmic adaptor subunit, partial [Candidatus Angelobacter sp.]|nr:efflux RND transporter periplasmic adaptor subunit [Candidatus Angelobacter sp.]